MSKLFPIIIITLNVGAAMVYFINHDYKHGIYWTSTAVLLSTVTL